MINIRVRFTRGEEVKYISHLDMLKVFERALRRANLPIAYNKGFNPRPQIVFGLPLSVGVTSEAEYADLELHEIINFEIFKEKLNKELPLGISIIEIKEKKSKDNIMAIINSAEYIIEVLNANENIVMNDMLKEFIIKDEILVEKISKKGNKKIDIKPLIGSVRSIKIENGDSIHAVFCAGSSNNLKPEIFMKGINEYFKLNLEIIKIHRKGLFVKKENIYYSPLDDVIISN